jgi:hypothetical protein
MFLVLKHNEMYVLCVFMYNPGAKRREHVLGRYNPRNSKNSIKPTNLINLRNIDYAGKDPGNRHRY